MTLCWPIRISFLLIRHKLTQKCFGGETQEVVRSLCFISQPEVENTWSLSPVSRAWSNTAYFPNSILIGGSVHRNVIKGVVLFFLFLLVGRVNQCFVDAHSHFVIILSKKRDFEFKGEIVRSLNQEISEQTVREKRGPKTLRNVSVVWTPTVFLILLAEYV